MRTFNDTMHLSDGVTHIDGYSAATSFTTDAYSLKNIAGYSVTVNLTDGNAIGQVKLQVSNDKAENGDNPTTWVDLTAPTTSIAAISATDAATNPVIYNCTMAFYKHVRVVYTRTSGTSSFTITINGKGF